MNSDDSSSVKSFDSTDEMEAYLERCVLNARANSTPAQLAVDHGDHFVVWAADVDELLFGYVYTPQEAYEQEVSSGASPSEARDIVARDRQDYAEGTRYRIWYSPLAPAGEKGYTHVQQMTASLTKDQFEEARHHEWSLPALLEAEVPWASQIQSVITGEELPYRGPST